ncbi:hypothetical protein D0T85_15450 [Bacteroides sp. 519]|nr:hypothetical protein [Bacteroides sp. 519]
MTMLLLTGCDNEIEHVNPVDEGTTLIIEVPEMEIPEKIRAIDDQVTRLDILVFESGTLKQYVPVTQTLDLSNNKTVTVTVKLKESTACQLVIVANTPTDLIGNFTLNSTKSTIFATNTIVSSDTGILTSNIPMYWESGTSEVIKKNPTSTENVFTVKLTRMSAKLNVKVDNVKEVKLYNAQTKGNLIPVSGNTNIPSTSTKTEVAITAGTPVYIFEANAIGSTPPSEPDRTNGPYLIVKCAYAGVDYYYPIDFTKRGTNDYMSILRNHSYEVTITKVLGAGYRNPEEAKIAYSVPANDENNFNMIGYRTLTYDLGRVNNFVYNGQYYLGATNILAGWDTGSYDILVSSSFNPEDVTDPTDPDYRKEWTIDKIEYQTAVEGGGAYTTESSPKQNDTPPNDIPYGGWFTLTSPISGIYSGASAPYKTTLGISLKPHNNEKATQKRTAIIYLTTGRLTLPIHVEQLPKPDGKFTIGVEPYPDPDKIIVPIDPQHNFRIYSNYINKPSNYNANNELKVDGGLTNNQLTFKMDTPFGYSITPSGVATAVSPTSSATAAAGQDVTVTFTGTGEGKLVFKIVDGTKTNFTYTLKFRKAK